MDFTQLIKPLSKYYTSESTRKAVEALQTFYIDEAYDNDDIIADWMPDCFEDSAGIDIFVESLNINQLTNNNSNKRVLYEHCCHYLLPNQPFPKHQLFEAPNKIIQEKFKSKLNLELELDYKYVNNMCRVFLNHLEENQYDIASIQCDLESINNSEIIDNIIQHFPEIQNHLIFKIYQVLSSITDKYTSTKTDSILSFRLTNTENYMPEATKLLQSNFTIHEGKHLVICKTWDIVNKFPLLMTIWDSFCRYALEHSKQIWNNDPHNVHNWTGGMKHWCENIDKNTKILVYNNENAATHLIHTLKRFYRELYSPMFLNYKLTFTIWDSLDAFCRYIISIHKFIHTISQQFECFPLHIDFMIIPQATTRSIFETSHIAREDLLGHAPSFLRMKLPEEITLEQKYKDQYLPFETTDRLDSVEDVTCYLQRYHFIKDKDFFGPFLSHTNEINIKKIYDILYKLFLNVCPSLPANQIIRSIVRYWCRKIHIPGSIMKIIKNYAQENETSNIYKRYIIVIDRRNPNDLFSTPKMQYVAQNKKTWMDRIYLICPKNIEYKWHSVIKCDSNEEYSYKTNETFLKNTEKYMLPNIGANTAANGYMFILSYHMYSMDIIKTYLTRDKTSMRFFISDCEWLLTRWFVTTDNKRKQFQTLSDDTKYELETAKHYKILDTQFQRYQNGIKVFT